MDEWGQGPWGDLTWLRTTTTTGPDAGNRRKERTVSEMTAHAKTILHASRALLLRIAMSDRAVVILGAVSVICGIATLAHKLHVI